mmetsp:Transcript_51640/g.59042  ORF Transcript_51640/g.59042 Transcript_51640/m.59042 type:complete len:313 (+) Transcript_51640:42-980(+)
MDDRYLQLGDPDRSDGPPSRRLPQITAFKDASSVPFRYHSWSADTVPDEYETYFHLKDYTRLTLVRGKSMVCHRCHRDLPLISKEKGYDDQTLHRIQCPGCGSDSCTNCQRVIPDDDFYQQDIGYHDRKECSFPVFSKQPLYPDPFNPIMEALYFTIFCPPYIINTICFLPLVVGSYISRTRFGGKKRTFGIAAALSFLFYPMILLSMICLTIRFKLRHTFDFYDKKTSAILILFLLPFYLIFLGPFHMNRPYKPPADSSKISVILTRFALALFGWILFPFILMANIADYMCILDSANLHASSPLTFVLVYN